MPHLLYNLPQALIRKIYEYDSTYKEKLNKEIFQELIKRRPVMISAFFKLVPVDDCDNRNQDEDERANYWLSLGTNEIIKYRDKYKKYPTSITRCPRIGKIIYGYKWKYGLNKKDSLLNLKTINIYKLIMNIK